MDWKEFRKVLIIFICFIFMTCFCLTARRENERLKKEIENQNMLIEILNRSCECACEYE